MAKKLADMNETIARSVVDGYQKMENSVVKGYKKIETGVVSGFHKVSDKAIDLLFTREGETAEEAKTRLAGKNQE